LSLTSSALQVVDNNFAIAFANRYEIDGMIGMGRAARQVFIARDGVQYGPYGRAELIQNFRSGAILPCDFYWEGGMTDWKRVALLPLARKSLATDAQRRMLDRLGIEYDEFLTKSEVTAIMSRRNMATPQQLALLEYLGVTVSPGISKSKASALYDSAISDESIASRRSTWGYDRYNLYPDLFAEERARFKASRAASLLGDYNDFRGDVRKTIGGSRNPLPKLQLSDVEAIVSKLDLAYPGWDRDLMRAMLDFLLPAIERTLPKL
jgi:GYF domain 2